MDQAQKEYRKTVLTPQTDFPMRAGLPKREPQWLDQWQKMGLYEKILAHREGCPTFILHDGPPYANGDIHLGHALNKILKDIIVRYKTMKGFKAPYVPGWDCHGLPIEQQVIKKLGSKIHDMEPATVRKLCQEYAAKYVDIQRKQFQRLGVSGDWERPYLTYHPRFESGILKVLRELVARNLVVKGMKCVHWDTVFRTALAEAEIEYHQHVSDSIYVSFALRDGDQYASLKGLDKPSLVIWTTTPWTLPANVAVCLHPEFDYVAIEHGDRHSIVAEGLAEDFMKACGIEGKVVRKFKGSELEHAQCDHPIFVEKSSQVILGEHVTLEAGTGCVHTAPGHGHDDFVIGAQYGLPVIVPVDERGCFTAQFPEMEGEYVFKANPKIIEMLRESGLLMASSKIEHDYPHSWRSHKPIIFRATEQWFMELDRGGVRQRALDAIDQTVHWIPSWGRERIRAMVEQRPDWCLSRQRSWGVPIPSIRSKKSGESILDVRLIDRFIERVAVDGTDVWFTEPLSAFWPDGFIHEPTGESHPDDFEKEFDILDVWFDSGASHVACLEQDERLSSPADLYLEGSDQHRGWFQSALLTSIGSRDRAPYRAVLTHGFILDADGLAMSKSKGNVISPLNVVKELGADILRLWIFSTDYLSDLSISKEIMARVAEAYRRIRNTMRFLIGNLYDFDPSKQSIEFNDLEEIDRWILSRLTNLTDQVTQAYDDYEFHRAYHLIYGFCNRELSAVYLDVVKDRLYCSAPDDATRRASQTTIHHLLDTLARLLAPVLVFTAEEVWEHGKFDDESIHITDFPKVNESWHDEKLEEKWGRLLELRDGISLSLEQARRDKTIGHSLDACLELRPENEETGLFFSENLALLKDLVIVSEVRIGAIGATGDENGDFALVTASEAPKCERCWTHHPEVGHDPDHPVLCPRCADVIGRLSTR